MSRRALIWFTIVFCSVAAVALGKASFAAGTGDAHQMELLFAWGVVAGWLLAIASD